MVPEQGGVSRHLPSGPDAEPNLKDVGPPDGLKLKERALVIIDG